MRVCVYFCTGRVDAHAHELVGSVWNVENRWNFAFIIHIVRSKHSSQLHSAFVCWKQGKILEEKSTLKDPHAYAFVDPALVLVISFPLSLCSAFQNRIALVVEFDPRFSLSFLPSFTSTCNLSPFLPSPVSAAYHHLTMEAWLVRPSGAN